MKRMLEEYGIIIVVICLILLILSFSTGALGKTMLGDLSDKTEKVTKLPKWADTESNESAVVESASVTLVTGRNFYTAIPDAATRVVFTTKTAPSSIEKTDLTVTKDGGVVGWLDGTTWYVSSQRHDKKIVFNQECGAMFAGMYGGAKLEEIDFGTVIDTSHVTSMSSMFGGSKKLKNLDLLQFDTSNVVKMQDMFGDCESLESIDISNFDLSSVESSYIVSAHKSVGMDSMFQQCFSLKNVKLPALKNSKVTTLYEYFASCFSLETVDLSSFDLSSVDIKHADLFNINVSGEKYPTAMSIKTVYVGSSADATKILEAYPNLNVIVK